MTMARSAIVAVLGVVAFSAGTATGTGLPAGGRAIRSDSTPPHRPAPVHSPVVRKAPGVGARGIDVSALTASVQRYCQSCHNPKAMKGNLDLEGFRVDSAAE